ncbi:DUF3631 domain-containing protein [Mycobacterium mantenii]|uniref:DUF3631 domain-containing protein n=1 Tax=Mycobacterium mantenii TaxID=560555 RepID=A0A1A2TAQ7_MYCNT|nr:hypothetical protein A5688_03165 [Mycobacterium mantenii]OBH73122.1 hypothetical protein A5683_25215 [Mycobacterium mantenii]
MAEDAAVREAGLKKQPPGMVLLTDLHAVWPAGRDFMPTLDLVNLLVAHNPGYWGDDSPYGKRLTETRLGRMLNQSTNTTSVRPGGKGRRGYPLSALRTAWDRLRIGRTIPDTAARNRINPANLEHKSGEPKTHSAELTESSGCTGLIKKAAEFDKALSPAQEPIATCDTDNSFNALRAEIMATFATAGQQTADSGEEYRAGVIETDTDPGLPGAMANSTTGLTDRVQRALAKARATTAIL